MNSILDEVNAIPVERLGQLFGLHVLRDGLAPCPCCNAEYRSRSERQKRAPIGLRADRRGWTCFACGEKGDGVTLVAMILFGVRLSRGDARWRTLVEECASVLGGGPLQMAPVHLTARSEVDAGAKRAPPDPVEVARFWASCAPLHAAPEAQTWCRIRGLPLARLEAFDLMRVVTQTSDSPPWAQFGHVPWLSSGHVGILPIFDPLGRLASVRARRLRGWVTDDVKFKSVAPRGKRAGGLLLGDRRFREVLSNGPGGEPARVVIVEGEPDFLTWATRGEPGDRAAYSTCGIFNGAWTLEAAGRIPRGSTVVVRTHDDDKGREYAGRIIATLDDSFTVVHAPAGGRHAG